MAPNLQNMEHTNPIDQNDISWVSDAAGDFRFRLFPDVPAGSLEKLGPDLQATTLCALRFLRYTCSLTLQCLRFKRLRTLSLSPDSRVSYSYSTRTSSEPFCSQAYCTFCYFNENETDISTIVGRVHLPHYHRATLDPNLAFVQRGFLNNTNGDLGTAV